MSFGNGKASYSSRSISSGFGCVPNPSINRFWNDFQKEVTYRGFTASQRCFAQSLFEGRHIFLTGAAGSGKSYVIGVIFAFLQKIGISVGKTGMTGVAAFNVGGQTLHSFMGIGLAEECVDELIIKVRKNRKACERIRAMEILFVDEISMMKASLLDKVDGVLKAIRRSEAPLGNCQLVALGDWLQLPPVWKGDEIKQFAFDAVSWKEAHIKTVVLKEVVRQSDSDFVRLLNGIRVGDTKDLSLLESRIDATFPDDGIEPVRIYCRNVDVNRVNKERLDQIPSPVKTFVSIDSGQPHHIESFNKNCPAPAVLQLKIGAQVRLLANVDVESGFVNGSLGVITAFGPAGVTVKFKHGTIIVGHNKWDLKEQEVGLEGKLRFKVVATRTQIPLKCCWAVTVHSIQGCTLDRAIVDMSSAFDYGMHYVALSRCRDLESMSIVDFSKSSIRVNQECLAFYKSLDSED